MQSSAKVCEVPVLVGPPWLCPVCHAPGTRLVSWHQALSPQQGAPTQIDEWGDHIWFLYGRPRACKAAGHTGRMVRVGNAITPIVFPYDDKDSSGRRPVEEQAADQVEAVRRIQAAIAHLVSVLELEERDPLTALVYRLVAGRVKPEQAIADIRDMFDRQLAGALMPDTGILLPVQAPVAVPQAIAMTEA